MPNIKTNKFIYLPSIVFAFIICLFFTQNTWADTVNAEETLSNGVTVSGTFSESSEEHAYKIVLDKTSYLELTGSITGTSSLGSGYMYLYDSSSNKIDYIYLVEKTDSLSCYLTAGTYYASIKSSNTYAKSWSLSYTATATNETYDAASNNAISTAKAITSGTTYTGTCCYNDLTDYYKLTLSKASYISLAYQNYCYWTTYLTVMDSSGATINSKSFFSSDNWEIYLSKGTYYVCLAKKSYNQLDGIYKLQANIVTYNTTVNESAGGSNNSFKKASTVKLNQKITGVMTVDDNLDYFKLTVKTKGTLNITFSTSAYTTLYVYNSSYGKVTSIFANSETEKTATLSKKGTYYIYVTNSSATSYQGIYTVTTSLSYESGKVAYKTTSSTASTVTGLAGQQKYKYFSGYNNPTSITIPAKAGGYSVTAVSSSAFANNKVLKSVVIGKNIKTINKKAFYKCTKLKTIKIKSTKLTTSTVKASAFKGVKKCTVTVPKAKASKYKTVLKKRGMKSFKIKKA